MGVKWRTNTCFIADKSNSDVYSLGVQLQGLTSVCAQFMVGISNQPPSPWPLYGELPQEFFVWAGEEQTVHSAGYQTPQTSKGEEPEYVCSTLSPKPQ